MLFITTSYSLKFPSGSEISHVPALCILVRRGGFSLVRWKEIVGVQWESGRVDKTDCDQQRVNLLQRRLKCFCQMSSDRMNIELALAEADGVLPYVYINPRISSWRCLRTRNRGPIQQHLARPPHRWFYFLCCPLLLKGNLSSSSNRSLVYLHCSHLPSQPFNENVSSYLLL